ncbi:hypothetical protein ES708_17269 [subsurface metagenome]
MILKIVEITHTDYIQNKYTHVSSVFTRDEYCIRLNNLKLQMRTARYTHVVIYGDREHYSNIHYFTGYDPRFEEALLIVGIDQDSTIVVGNEGIGYVTVSPLEMNIELFQSLSLMGQPRDKSIDLISIFSRAGITKLSRVGIIGWKYFQKEEQFLGNLFFEVPHYLVKNLKSIVGWDNLRNASDLMVHPEYGLRISMSVHEIAVAEMAGTKSSQSVINVMRSLSPGKTEYEVSKSLNIDSDPLSAYPNVNFGGKNVSMGLASPSLRQLKIGDPVNIGFGYRYSMVARTGLFVSNKREIPVEMDGIIDKLYIPYFRMLVAWYEALAIGMQGGDVYHEVLSEIGHKKEELGISLNLGHFIHSDEWTNSPFFESSSFKLKSGMAIQCDIIAAPGEPYIGVHVEDGLVLADEKLRISLQELYPDSWKRIQCRRTYIKNIIGINLVEEVLPFSDIQATLNPFLGNIEVAFAKR